LVVDQTETLETSKKDGGDCKIDRCTGAAGQVVLHFGDRHYDPPPVRRANPRNSDLFSFIEMAHRRQISKQTLPAGRRWRAALDEGF